MDLLSNNYCDMVSLQNTQKWLTEQRKLAKHTDEVDYDVEGMKNKSAEIKEYGYTPREITVIKKYLHRTEATLKGKNLLSQRANSFQ